MPIVGSGLDIYEGIRDGDGWQVAMGVGFLILDVATLGSASLVKGTVKTSLKIGKNVVKSEGAIRGISQGTKLLTQGAKALHKHHVLPRQFKKWFASRGINNIDDFAVQISQSSHLKGVHGRGLGNLPGRWNQHWSNFIKANPNASPASVRL